MHRLKTLTGHSLWTREARFQATEVAIRAGVFNRMAALARPPARRPHRLNDAPWAWLRFQIRFMQKRLWDPCEAKINYKN